MIRQGWFAVMTLVLAAVVGPAAQDAVPPALLAMAETEREFARAARVKGIRDSFLEFFAADSIAFTPDAVPARARLLEQKSTPFAVNELLWEPRTGDVAASGELGWLTGPSTFIDHSAKDAAPHYGNYLSVWRKQPDGRWRVFIDVGSGGLKGEAAFAPGFSRMPFGVRYSGNEDKVAAGRSLLEADKALNARFAASGAAAAYADDITEATRLHRAGGPPAVGPAAIRAWLTANATGMTATSTSGEASAAGDFGYTYGKYDVPSSPPQSGAYVRVWSRDATGRWLVVADVTQPTPPRKQ